MQAFFGFCGIFLNAAVVVILHRVPPVGLGSRRAAGKNSAGPCKFVCNLRHFASVASFVTISFVPTDPTWKYPFPKKLENRIVGGKNLSVVLTKIQSPNRELHFEEKYYLREDGF